MDRARLRMLVARHKTSIIDLSVLTATMAVATYIAFTVDIFANEDKHSYKANTVELDEALLLGVILIAGLFVFGMRRHLAQKREIARRIAAEQHARELAYQDGLTGLPNRRQFEEALAEALGSPPGADATHAVLMLDLNGFKRVNDVHGHGTGDEVLVVVGRRLRQAVRDGDLVARLGGDEFAILARHLHGAEGATTVARRIIACLEAPVATGPTSHAIGTAIGIALVPADAGTIDEALRKADVALYRAKAERRSAARFFEPGMDRLVRERAALEDELRAAIAAREVEALFTPTVDLETRGVVGFEASPRWWRHNGEELPPERFVPIAEEAGLLHALWTDVLRQACTAAVLWPPAVSLSVDIEPGQLRDERMPDAVAAILADTGLAPGRLELDVTEAAVVRDIEAARTAFARLRDVGVRIALDNFGTGYSSLYHLRAIKLDKLKIDASFVSGMGAEEESAEIVGALVGLGHGLGLPVAAKGISDGAQRAGLIGTGCDQGQGQLFSRAVTWEETVALLTGEPPLDAPSHGLRRAG